MCQPRGRVTKKVWEGLDSTLPHCEEKVRLPTLLHEGRQEEQA